MFKRMVLHLIITAISVTIAANVIQGVSLEGGIWGALIVAAVLGVLNTLVRPALLLLTLPINLLTLGLFTLVVNALVLGLAAWFTTSLYIEGFVSAFFAAIVVSLFNTILGWFVPED